MIEFGIMNYLIKKEISLRSGSCPTSVNIKVKGNQIRSLELKDFYGVFMIYVGGLDFYIFNYTFSILAA